MDKAARFRAERHLDSLFSYLFRDRAGIAESARDAFARYADSVNAFYDVEAFSVCSGRRHSFRIGCQCGWGLSVAAPLDLALEMDLAPLAECLRRMVLHYEIRHDGLRGAGVLR